MKTFTDVERDINTRVLLISGSDRRQYNSPGFDSESRSLMMRMRERLPKDWMVDTADLGNIYGRAKIQSCNGCVATSKALCCWPCNCYEKNNKTEPDLMWDLDMYARLDMADAWAIIGPVNWYAPSSNLKLLFDRLICMNGGNPREDLIDHKDPALAMTLEHSDKWNLLSLNHLEGRTAGFFCYGDGRVNELDKGGRPKILRHKQYFDPGQEPFQNGRDAYAPLVWQCRFSGIEVPEPLWKYAEHFPQEDHVLEEFDQWTDAFAAFVQEKGKVEPGRYPAAGYEPPGHALADLKLKWRELRMRMDAALHPDKSELQS